MARALSFIGDSHTFDDWRRTWDAREAALAAPFGPPEPSVFHSTVPLNRGGGADVLIFRGYVPGVTYVTADLTGAPDGDALGQMPNSSGAYELMLCTRAPAPWAAPALAQLARYTPIQGARAVCSVRLTGDGTQLQLSPVSRLTRPGGRDACRPR